MRFWDSSALVPLVAAERTTRWALDLIRSDFGGVVWFLSPTEVRSALARRHRDQLLSREEFRCARTRAEQVFAAMATVPALELVRDRALRILDAHSLRAADSLQLAAALVASRERPRDLPFVTLDERLGEAAEREGFPLITHDV